MSNHERTYDTVSWGERVGMRGKMKGATVKFTMSFFTLIFLVISFIPSFISAEKISTKVIVRVVARDAQVIGSGVGGALIRIKNLETGVILAEGKQEGGAGNSDRIMVQPRQRGETIYGTSGAAFFEAKILLDKPTQVEIYTEAPLAYPQAIQKGSKTLTLIPGKHILGEGVIIELNGLIVNILNPSRREILKKGGEILVRAEVKML
jgi:hypothetical protein